MRHILLLSLFTLMTCCVLFAEGTPAPQKKTVKTATKGETAVTLPAVLTDVERILFYGDSLTDGSSYPDFVGHSINAAFPRANIEWQNSAKCGDNTRDLLRRFDEDVLAKSPDLLSICIGTNDVLQKIPVEEYEKNLNTIVEKASAAKIKVLLFLPSPLSKAENEERFQPFLDVIRKTAKAHSLTLINAHDLFLAWEKDGKEVMGPDGIHHGEHGFACMARAFLNGIGLENAELLQTVTPWEGALTNWEISAPVIVTKENKDSYFNLANAKGWTPFDTQTAIEGAAWYDKPLLQRGGVMPMLVTKLEKGQKGYVFCRTTLTTEASAKAQLQVGGSPSMHVYCNGELVWSQTGAHGYHPNADRVEVSLKKGKNEFVVCTNFVAFLNLPMPEIQ